MPARRRTSPSPATRRPKVAGTTPAGRPEVEGDGPTLTGIRTPRPAATGTVTRARTQPAEPDPAGPASVDTASVGPASVGPASVDPASVDTGSVDTAADAASVETGEQPSTDLVERLAADDPDVEDATTPRGRRRPRRTAPDEETPTASGPGRLGGLLTRLRTVPVLAAVLVVLVALAAFFGIAVASVRSAPSAANSALTDLAATSEVSNQLGDALEALYSYDFARLDENERAARDVITEGFTPEFERLFGQVRELAPQQQAVVSAVVSVSAVQMIEGDRAVLVAFMDQQATTAASEEQVAAAGRLTVTGELVDGRWKIAAVESR